MHYGLAPDIADYGTVLSLLFIDIEWINIEVDDGFCSKVLDQRIEMDDDDCALLAGFKTGSLFTAIGDSRDSKLSPSNPARS